MYSPRACPVAQDQAFSYVYARGDFDETPTESLFLRDVGSTLSELPATTRAIVVDVSEQSSNLAWWGAASVPPDGDVSILVWPKNETCGFTRNIDRVSGAALGVFGRHVGVFGGQNDSARVLSWVGDLRSGTLEQLGDESLLKPRSNATVTAFGLGADDDPMPALVAGGEDYEGHAIDTAEVYVGRKGAPGDLGGFDRARIVNLAFARKKHGAVVLRDGSTLLVGGLDDHDGFLPFMERIDPHTGTSTTNVARLKHPRANPTVLRLADGEILVAGGTDQKGAAVEWLEFFTPDASAPSKPNPVELVTGAERAYVPLAAGGALAVIRPDSAAASPDFKTVWVISPDGSLAPGIPIDPADLDAIRLYRGAGGRPVLWNGWRWLQWDPWFGVFQPVPDAPSHGPCETRAMNPPPCSTSIVSGDSGLALWLEDRGGLGLLVTGWRFDVRTAFDNVHQDYLVTGPEGLAPDRIANQPGSSIQYGTVTGLQLGAGAAAFLTDVTLADFTLDLDVASGPPSIVLRPPESDAFVVGGAACAYGQPATKTLHVERRGKSVSVRSDDRDAKTCPTELPSKDVRVELGLQGTAGFDTSGAKNLRISRR